MGRLIRHRPFITDIMEGRINRRKGRTSPLPRKTFIGEMIKIMKWLDGGCNGCSHIKTLALKIEECKFIFA